MAMFNGPITKSLAVKYFNSYLVFKHHVFVRSSTMFDAKGCSILMVKSFFSTHHGSKKHPTLQSHGFKPISHGFLQKPMVLNFKPMISHET